MKENQNEFKVGEWVKQVKENYSDFPRYFKIKYVLLDNTYGVENNIYDIDAIQNTNNQFELWQPKDDEWCWFYKKNSKNPVFAKFVRLLDSNLGNFVAKGFTPNGTDKEDKLEYGYFYSCEPFIGELPYEC